MAELLVELFSEEIPARMQARAADDLKRLATDAFKAAGLAFARAEAFVTPRRLALVVDGLPVAQPDVKEERRGPRVDAPQNAIDGFLRASGLTLGQCEQRDTGKGVFYFAVVEKKGRATADVLAELLPKIFAEQPWPKSMRWADEPTRWVRPLHGIVAVFDGKVVPVTFAGVTSSDESRGHRFLGPKPFKSKSFSEYKARLREAYVVLDAADRRAAILADASATAKDAGFQLKRDDGLLDEVTGLVEWPVALLGSIDEQFMDVPPEVLTTSMRTHQKYFAVENADGTLAPRFVVIANMLTEDGGQQVVAGNERVLRARLSDARFFWDQDRKHSLESHVDSLRNIVFHAKLGTVAEKVARVKSLAREIAGLIGADAAQAARAAELCKADLVTGMVGEFPELQGIMGRYYARHDNEPAEVAEAIAAHYSPKGPDDACPTAPVSVALALADKIDTLVGFFNVDIKPTGSGDPFALRRAALGVIRLILENNLRLPLRGLIETARRISEGQSQGDGPEVSSPVCYASPENGKMKPAADLIAELLPFFADRLKVTLREKGVRHDLIDAVFSLGGEDDLVRLIARVDALQSFLASDDGANLLTAYKRASNIVGIEEKKDKATYDQAVDAKLLALPEESTLAQALAKAHEGTALALKTEDFGGAMTVLALLRGPVDAFFDKVKVNADEPEVRKNRLRLLSQIRATLGGVADFSKIEG
ncbi:MAG TPA: glycine--tRNA ligase subunit beta [Alphaproteobacteria bacterium]|jgi:glycyl-tRNA synthetase beta chain